MLLSAHPFGELVPTGERVPLDEETLLAPILPSKVIGIGRNYAEHAKEMGGETTAEPLLFLKPSTAVIGPGKAISMPPTRVDFEGELAVVIGRLCSQVPAARAQEVILGYTCGNDVTARDWQRGDGQWTRAKGGDTFCPLGAVDRDRARPVRPAHTHPRRRGGTAGRAHLAADPRRPGADRIRRAPP